MDLPTDGRTDEAKSCVDTSKNSNKTTLRKSFCATWAWNRRPQFFTHVSNTVRVYMTTVKLRFPTLVCNRFRMARIASRGPVSPDSLIKSQT